MPLGFATDASVGHGPVATGPCFNHPLDGREKAPHLRKRGGLRRVEPISLLTDALVLLIVDFKLDTCIGIG